MLLQKSICILLAKSQGQPFPPGRNAKADAASFSDGKKEKKKRVEGRKWVYMWSPFASKTNSSRGSRNGPLYAIPESPDTSSLCGLYGLWNQFRFVFNAHFCYIPGAFRDLYHVRGNLEHLDMFLKLPCPCPLNFIKINLE